MSVIVRIVTFMILAIMLPSTARSSKAEFDFQCGIVLFENAEYSKAAVFFESIAGKYPLVAEIQYYYALSLLKSREAETAETIIQRAIDIDPRNAEYIFGLAKIHEAQSYEASLIGFSRLARRYKDDLEYALELDPDHIGATKAYANYLLDFPRIIGGNKRKGAGVLEKLEKLHEVSAIEIKAVSAWNSDNTDEAIELFHAALSMDGSTASVRLRLGQLYFDGGEYEKAIPFLEEYLIHPKTWSETVVSLNATLYLASASYFVGNNENFKKYALAAEQASLGEAGRIYIRGKYAAWGIPLVVDVSE